MYSVPPSELAGLPFKVPLASVGETCVDYWFEEPERISMRSHPMIPEAFTPIARDPGDDLILLHDSGSVHFLNHEDGEIVSLASGLDSFLDQIRTNA